MIERLFIKNTINNIAFSFDKHILDLLQPEFYFFYFTYLDLKRQSSLE